MCLMYHHDAQHRPCPRCGILLPNSSCVGYKFCNLDPKPTHAFWVLFLTRFRLMQSEYSNQSSADDENWELFKADDFRMYCMKVPTPALLTPALPVVAARL